MASVSALNKKALNDGFKQFEKIADQAILQTLVNTAYKWIGDMVAKKEYQGFTGNTQTSYVVGIYRYGKLYNVIYQSAWNAPPIRLKVPYGKVVRLKEPYEGGERFVRGQADVNRKYGAKTAVDFLRKYRKVEKKGWDIVAATGTEYSEYIETVLHLNVLTATYSVAGQLAKQSITPVK